MAIELPTYPAKGDADWDATLNSIFEAFKEYLNTSVPAFDENGKLTMAQMPSAVSQGTSYQGTFDPTTGLDDKGTTIPAPSDSNHGFYWIASKAGSFTPPGGSAALSFNIGDGLTSNGIQYDIIPETSVDLIARNAANASQMTANNASTAASAAQGTANTANSKADANAASLNNKADKSALSPLTKIKMGNYGNVVNSGTFTKDPFGRLVINLFASKDEDFGNLEIIAILPAGYVPARVDMPFKFLSAAGNGVGVGYGFIQYGIIYVESPPSGVRIICTDIVCDL